MGQLCDLEYFFNGFTLKNPGHAIVTTHLFRIHIKLLICTLTTTQ